MNKNRLYVTWSSDSWCAAK